MSVIYKIVNPKGNVYIGQTVDFKKRINTYRRGHHKSQARLHNSIKKYGYKNHIIEIIENCKEEELNTRERYWQEYYNVLGENGLNCKLTRTTDKSGRHSKETREKQSRANKGKTIPQEVRDKIRSTLQGREPINKGTKGLYSQTEESNKKRSETGKISSTCSKKVLQYTKDGTFIQEWSSARQVGISLGKQSGSAIIECCKGKRKSIYGFIFKYKTEVI